MPALWCGQKNDRTLQVDFKVVYQVTKYLISISGYYNAFAFEAARQISCFANQLLVKLTG